MGRVVYRSDQGRVCPSCGSPAADCRCAARNGVVRGDGIVRIRREVKGRKGKTVTTVSGVQLPPDELKQLASDLKRRCGCGGSIRDGVVEIQGDHVELLMKELSARGCVVKKAGG